MARTILDVSAGAVAPPLGDPAGELLGSARAVLERATGQSAPAVRYELAYLSALRSAAAVLACRARPRSLRTRPRGIWRLLARAAPELGEWAEYFALVAEQRDALAAGRGAVSSRQADDLLRDALLFSGLAHGCVLHREHVRPESSAEGLAGGRQGPVPR
jgi:hypothetical protein